MLNIYLLLAFTFLLENCYANPEIDNPHTARPHLHESFQFPRLSVKQRQMHAFSIDILNRNLAAQDFSPKEKEDISRNIDYHKASLYNDAKLMAFSHCMQNIFNPTHTISTELNTLTSQNIFTQYTNCVNKQIEKSKYFDGKRMSEKEIQGFLSNQGLGSILKTAGH